MNYPADENLCVEGKERFAGSFQPNYALFSEEKKRITKMKDSISKQEYKDRYTKLEEMVLSNFLHENNELSFEEKRMKASMWYCEAYAIKEKNDTIPFVWRFVSHYLCSLKACPNLDESLTVVHPDVKPLLTAKKRKTYL